MAYRNPKTGRVYLTLKMAPICNIYGDRDACRKCPVYMVAKLHGFYAQIADNVKLPYYRQCHSAIEHYSDDIAKMIGYEKVVVDN